MGSAFISIYGIFIIFLGFVLSEIFFWKNRQFAVKPFIKRYIPLMGLLLVPPIIGGVYFATNHALMDCYEQAYLFNREIYPKYQSIGNSLLEPFISGIASVSKNFVSSLLTIGKESLTTYNLLFIVLIGMYLAGIASNIYKKSIICLRCILLH